MKCLLFALTLFAVLAAVSPCRADGELRALQDSVVRWLAAHPDDLLAEAAADVGGQGEELFGGELLVGQAHHVVQDGRQRGVAPQSDLGDDDACDACGVIQQRRSVVAHLFFKAFGGICQRLVDEPLRGLGKICGDERPQLVVTCRLHSSARF